MDRLGPYRIIRRLGQGGMAEVFLAIAYGASGFEKKVVLKRLLPELAGDTAYVRMFIDEAKLHARLNHRGLVQVHELAVCEGAYYVRLDHVDGASLEALAAREPPPAGLALLIGAELALALDYVHRVKDDAGRPLGLVHRDVSPSNVLLSREGEVKLADFGIAKATLLKEQTMSGVRKGKYAYMSPEQISGRQLTAHSDQFSLGVLVCEALCGARPFDGATPLETMDRIREASAPELKGVPGPLAEVLRRCLAREPADRFESAAALRSALCAAGAVTDTPALAEWVRRTAGD